MGKRWFSNKGQGKNIGFQIKVTKNLCFLGKSGVIFFFQNVFINSVWYNLYFSRKFCYHDRKLLVPMVEEANEEKYQANIVQLSVQG